MKLISLKTSGYRNLCGEALELSDGINLLYGSNAAGKTNTLECVYIFASGKSFKTTHEAELIKKGGNTASAGIVIEKDGYNEDMSVIWHNSKEKGYVKRMLYRGCEVPKMSEFLGVFRAVLFTPDHLSLIKGSPDERRRLMDVALSQMQPRYIHFMNSYLKILSQKNSYLKQAQLTGRVDEDYLDILNEQLAKAAAVVIKQRSGFAERLCEYAADMYSKISGSKEALDVKYVSATKKNFSDTAYTENRLIEIYKKEKDTEIRNGRTYYGPHRDDLMIYISSGQPFDDSAAEQTENGENAIGEFAARTFGSQGQQRSAVLAIKLAEGEICKSITGEYPVFLFDDLLGELDNERRSCLASLIRDRQAIITCCDRDAMPDMKNIASVRVADGRYYKE